MLTGVWSDKNGVTGEDFKRSQFQTYHSFLTRLKQTQPSAVTASIVGDGAINQHIVQADLEQKVIRTDNDVTIAALKQLKRVDLTALFVQMPHVSDAGVLGGFDPQEFQYRLAVERADGHIGQMVHAIRTRPTYDKEKLVDHCR